MNITITRKNSINVISLALLLTALLMFLQCNKGNDILATYNGGAVTRQEFMDWLELNYYKREVSHIMKYKTLQIQKLQEMCKEKIMILEAKKLGYDKQPYFANIKELYTDQEIMKYFLKKEIEEKAKIKEPIVHILALYINDVKEDSYKKAVNVIATCKSKSFLDVYKQYSNNPKDFISMDFRYKFLFMLPESLQRGIENLGKNEYSMEPIIIKDGNDWFNSGIYIVFKKDQRTATLKNLYLITNDKKEAHDLKNIVLIRLLNEYIDKLRSKKDVYFNYKALDSNAVNTILFTIGNKSVKVSDFNERIKKLIESKIQLGSDVTIVSEMTKKSFKDEYAWEYFTNELVKRVFYEKGYHNDPEFVKSLNDKLDMILEIEFKKHLAPKNVNVTLAEIKEEYELTKDRYYAYTESVEGKQIKKYIPLEKVKDEIKRILENQKKEDFVNKYKSNLALQYTVTLKTESI